MHPVERPFGPRNLEKWARQTLKAYQKRDVLSDKMGLISSKMIVWFL